MSEVKNFLFEIGTEELPPKTLFKVAANLATNVENGLKHAGLSHGAIKFFATPRRLAVLVFDLVTKQPDHTLELRGPAVTVAYDQEGKPTKALQKFLENNGITINQLEKLETPKGAWVVAHKKKSGRATDELLPEIINQALESLHTPKQMRWGNGKYTFIRPVHWLLMLYGNEIVPATVFGKTSSNVTYGHRFHHPAAITITSPEKYAEILAEQGFVIAEFEARKQMIFSAVQNKTNIGKVLIDENLLNEVTGLVEWPVVLLGTFDAHFLEVPQEVLLVALEAQQRYFPVVDQEGKLLPHFVLVSNIKSSEPVRVITGNEKVLRARFTDAEYFYRTDLQFTLDSLIDRLKQAVFQDKLGSIYLKTERLAKLTSFLAEKVGVATALAKRAAELSKADLVTTMVFEFPELQGVMGYYYALQQFESESVAIALKEQYLPRFAQDKIPDTDLGAILAISDRLDTLVGFFGINKIPTGEKDPQGLRRAATGILRIILERKLNLDLKELLEFANSCYSPELENTLATKQVLDFILERLRAMYLENGGDANVYNAVLATHPTKPLDFQQRLAAINFFKTLAEAEALSAAHKRVNNILNKTTISDEIKFSPKLAKEVAEKALAEIIEKNKAVIATLAQQGNYKEALELLATFKPAIDAFFDSTMVMVENEKLRNNRLALLRDLRALFLSIADISLI